MTNRRAKIAATATVLGLGALGGVALGTNPGVPATGQQPRVERRLGLDRDQRQRGLGGAHRPDRRPARRSRCPCSDRHPRQRGRPRSRCGVRRLSRGYSCFREVSSRTYEPITKPLQPESTMQSPKEDPNGFEDEDPGGGEPDG